MEIKTVNHMCKHVLRNCADSKTKILTFFSPHLCEYKVGNHDVTMLYTGKV